MKNITIASFYCFSDLENLPWFQNKLLVACKDSAIKGSILLANEGINGTVAGQDYNIKQILEIIKSFCTKEVFNLKLDTSFEVPFTRMKVRIKKEIITMGLSENEFSNDSGHYVDPINWNELLEMDDVIAIDTRNTYEVAIGTFKGAVNPKIDTFSDFPKWWSENKQKLKNKRIAMFCTGGIRCEKSTKFLINQGVTEVMHLKGGILNYLKETPEQSSAWEGECFVFDQRVSVIHGLRSGESTLCFACRYPLSLDEKLLPEYEDGVSCHLCYNTHTPDRRVRFRERQKQITLKASRKLLSEEKNPDK